MLTPLSELKKDVLWEYQRSMLVQVECVRPQALLLHLLLSSNHLCTRLGLPPWSVLQVFCTNCFLSFAEGKIGRRLSPSLQRKMIPNPKPIVHFYLKRKFHSFLGLFFAYF
jgi:hypothetical protein